MGTPPTPTTPGKERTMLTLAEIEEMKRKLWDAYQRDPRPAHRALLGQAYSALADLYAMTETGQAARDGEV